MAIDQYQFESTLLLIVKDMILSRCDVDIAIGHLLDRENLDEDDPALWSELRYSVQRLWHLFIVAGHASPPELLTLVVRLGVLREIRPKVQTEWLGVEAPTRPEIGISNLLKQLQAYDRGGDGKWWRLYTRCNRTRTIRPGSFSYSYSESVSIPYDKAPDSIGGIRSCKYIANIV